MPKIPAEIELVEVGPRDGFQAESLVIPTQDKLQFIQNLLDAGIRKIQATSFVSRSKVPQLADAEELLALLPRYDGVSYSALALNTGGVRRALQSQRVDLVEISLSASNTHSLRNTGMDLEQARQEAMQMARMCLGSAQPVKASIQCAFGCLLEGRIPAQRVLDIASDLAQAGISSISLADTTGMAAPPGIESLVSSLQGMFPDIQLGLHLHDTRGLGLVNMYCGLQQGVSSFDAAIGGLGGCPFVPGAAGNICSEDALYLCRRLGIETGIDLQALVQMSRELQDYLGRALPARINSRTWQGEMN
ncbi:MAG: hydroxymethylglutaryl-CoA lyase [Desulfohalobiaceae bacterium]